MCVSGKKIRGDEKQSEATGSHQFPLKNSGELNEIFMRFIENLKSFKV